MNNVNRPADSFMVLPGMKPAYTFDPKHARERCLPSCTWLSNRVRHILISMLGEFAGTYLFLFFAFAGTQVANTPPAKSNSPPNVGVFLYISLAFGFSLAVNVWIFFRISCGLFNPAVSIAFALVGSIGWLKAALLIFSQVVAGIAAAGAVSALFPGPLTIRTSLNANTSVVRGLFIEMLLIAELIFCIFMLAFENRKVTFLAPIGIGLSLFIAELAGGLFTGGALNPARSFGPDVILWNFDGYHWIYWLGPVLGAIIAVIFYRLIKNIEYEAAAPGPDSGGPVDRYTESTEPVTDTQGASRRVDGTNDSESIPPFHPVNKPLGPQPIKSKSPPNVIFNWTDTSAEQNRPLPVYLHGGDGHRSQSFVDRHDDRPRTHHSQTHRSTHSRHSGPESDLSYRSGPSVESATSTGSSRSSSTQ